MAVPAVVFDHLLRLSDDLGLFEHAELTRPRLDHGYCVDDVARGLRVAVRAGDAEPAARALAETYLRFVLDAQAPDGRFHNRRDVAGAWTDEATLDDCWGRALWGLGTAVAHAPELAPRALAAFDRGAGHRSPHLRATAFAALGAADVLVVRPGHAAASELLAGAATSVRAGISHGVTVRPGWPWPEPRLRYANAVLPEVLIAAGSLLEDQAVLAEGLALLHWLLGIETAGGHLSVTPVGGWGPGEPRPGFDQQPIEVAALADACARAHGVTGDPAWRAGVVAAAAWFEGDNDSGTVLLDVDGGGCRDGLEAGGGNQNQGAESTLALMSTFQQAHRVAAVGGALAGL